MRLELIYRPSMDSPPARSTAVTAAAVVAILAGLFLLLCFSVALLALLIGTWWLILFNRKSVKAQFARQGESADQGPQKLACPLPIAVLGWFYVASVLNLLFLPLLSFHLPLFVFGRVLPGSTGGAVLMF